MNLVTNEIQIINNLRRFENYLTTGSVNEKIEVMGYLQRGICFIAYKPNNEYRFLTSKLAGYTNNSLKVHVPSNTDGRITNRAISSILGSTPKYNKNLEEKYFNFCNYLGFVPSKTGRYGKSRRYWLMNLKDDFPDNEIMQGEFPEGKIIERIHKLRERNRKVIEIAKLNFIKEHGHLFCQICSFDFEKTYGNLGKEFIEAHHTIPVSDMKPDHITKPEEIVLLCGNCHRMIHRKRPWLSMQNIKKILRMN